METFELYIIYVSWRSSVSLRTSGKNRPVLVLLVNEDTVSVYPITSQFDNKSEAIKARYFKIADWPKSGLEKQSYIDTGMLITLPKIAFVNKRPIGKLTSQDKKRFLTFLAKKTSGSQE
jgi:hypothetical protein